MTSQTEDIKFKILKPSSEYRCGKCHMEFTGHLVNFVITPIYKNVKERENSYCVPCADRVYRDCSEFKLHKIYNKNLRCELTEWQIGTLLNAFTDTEFSTQMGSYGFLYDKRIKRQTYKEISWIEWCKTRDLMIDSNGHRLLISMCMSVIHHGPLFVHCKLLKAYNDFRFNLLHDGTSVGERIFFYDPEFRQLYVWGKSEKTENTWLNLTGFDFEASEQIKLMSQSHNEAWAKSKKHQRESKLA